jgi:xanthine/CO dehydrogenase XdhC/CoxF family maturation factor
LSTDPTYLESLQSLQALVARAVADASFRQQLIESPTQELKNAGLEVPSGVNVHVQVNTETDIYLVIPSSPPKVPPERNVAVLLNHLHWF